MKSHSVFLTLLFAIVFSSGVFSQTVVTKTVEHITDVPSTLDGCSVVTLEVQYTIGGINHIVASSPVQLDQNNSVNLSATVPAGGTIVNTRVHFEFNSSSNWYKYIYTNTNNSVEIHLGSCNCPPISSRYLRVQEITGKNAKLVYYTTDTTSGGC